VPLSGVRTHRHQLSADTTGVRTHPPLASKLTYKATLAWLLAQGEHIVPIPGTRSAARMEENAHAADVALTEADLAAIHEILPNGGFGARYAEEHAPNWV
jgi:aryl-alcohol dehydrogenase-like predicted oxidoreductase